MHPFTRETFPASAAVRPFVSDYWMIRWPDGFAEDRVVHLPPDGSIHIVYRVDTADASTCRALRSVLYVKGPSHRANREKATCAPILLGFRLRPGMSQSLLPIAAVELANRVCDLAALRPEFARALRARLDRNLNPRCLFTELDSALATELAGCADRVDGRVLDCVRSMQATGDLPPGNGLSGRQLSRLFAIHVGMSPKRFARVLRFQGALRKGPPPRDLSWARWIPPERYADQAHFVREFREMTTFSPSAYFTRSGDACPFTSSPNELGRRTR